MGPVVSGTDKESGPSPDLSPCSRANTYVVNEDADEVEAPSASDADAVPVNVGPRLRDVAPDLMVREHQEP